MNKKLAFDNRLCYERDVIRQQALHQRRLEQVVPTSHSPSRVYLDSNAPAPHPHLATNAKKQQTERDRQLEIYHQNLRLANKMDQIMNRQDNIVLAASSSSTRSRQPQRSHLKPGEPLMPRVPGSGDATARVQTPVTSSSAQRRKPVHSPAHTLMPGIRLDSTQTPLLDCHLSPEYAIGRGDACKKPTLMNRAVQKRRQNAIDQENRRLKERLAHLKPYYNTKKWDGEWQQHAHKFGHLRQDGTVGYLLPLKSPLKKIAPPSRGGCRTTRERGLSRGGTNNRELPSLDNKSKHNVSRAGRLKELQDRRSDSCARYEDEPDDDEGPQARELPPCLLLEATTRQGVEVAVDELQIELIRSGIAELGDRGLMIRGSWKDGIFGELFVNHETLVQVAQIVDDLDIMIKLETVLQVPTAGNVPSLSSLLTDNELQKLLVGVVQQLRFQVTPTPPNTAPTSQLLISWALPVRDNSISNGGSSNSPRERLRPRTCPSTIVSDNETRHQNSEIQDDDYPDDFNQMTFRSEADPLDMDWAIRYKTAALLNLGGRRWRSVLRKGTALYLVSSWFEEEAGIQTINTVCVGSAAGNAEVPSVVISYNIGEMDKLLRQLDEGTLNVPDLLKKTVMPLLP